MTARETVAWGDLTDDAYVIVNFGTGDEVHHLAKVFTIGGTTTIVFANTGRPDTREALKPVELATADEIAVYQRQQDRFTVETALRNLGRRIVDNDLPVPVGGRGIVLSFDLADDADLKPWAEFLSKRPQRGTSRPHIVAEAEGVEVYVYGPGNTGEFGPELAEPSDVVIVPHGPVKPPYGSAERAAYDVERRDAVGAFPVASCAAELLLDESIAYTCRGALGHAGAHFSRDHEHEWVDREQARAEAEQGKSKPVGWPLGDGHRPTPPADAMTQDRYDNGEDA